MNAITARPDEFQDGPKCDHCGAPTRLFGIEAHPTVMRAELLTYVCAPCDRVQTDIALLRPAGMSSAKNEAVAPVAARNGYVLPFFDSSAFDSETVAFLSQAFEAAWQRVRLPSSAAADPSRVDRFRELLAKQVIEMGKRGERNRDRLVQSALDRLAGSTAASGIEIAPGP
jgi:hypothetical protein